MRASHFAVAVALLVRAAAAGADVALNPQGTDGVVFGTLYVRPTPGRAGLNMDLLATDPPSAEPGILYCVDAPSRHECCFRTDSPQPYCWGATPQPTLTPAVRAQVNANTRTPTPTRTPLLTPAVPPQYLDNNP